MIVLNIKQNAFTLWKACYISKFKHRTVLPAIKKSLKFLRILKLKFKSFEELGKCRLYIPFIPLLRMVVFNIT